MLIIFDCDGVLRNTSWHGMYIAYIELFKYKKKDHKKYFNDINEFKKWWGHDYQKKLFECAGYSYDELPLLNSIFHKHHDQYIATFSWVKSVLSDLSKKHTLALLSASSRQSIDVTLVDIRQYFSITICSTDVKKIKPDPEGIQLILDFVKANPDEAIIIGDTEIDIIAGKNAGILTGIVSWSEISPAENLAHLNPDYTFLSHKDFYKL